MKISYVLALLIWLQTPSLAETPKPVIGIACNSKSVKAATGAVIEADPVSMAPPDCGLVDSTMYMFDGERAGDLFTGYAVRCKHYAGEHPSQAFFQVACQDKKVVSVRMCWSFTEDMDTTLKAKYGEALRTGPIYSVQFKGKGVDKGMLLSGAKKVEVGTLKHYKGRFPNESIFSTSTNVMGVNFQEILYIDNAVLNKFIEFGKTLGPKKDKELQDQNKKAKDGLL